MTCKEKYNLTPYEILALNYGLRDGKSMTHLDMKMDALKEIIELKNLENLQIFSQSYEQIRGERIIQLKKDMIKDDLIYMGDEATNIWHKSNAIEYSKY